MEPIWFAEVTLSCSMALPETDQHTKKTPKSFPGVSNLRLLAFRFQAAEFLSSTMYLYGIVWYIQKCYDYAYLPM